MVLSNIRPHGHEDLLMQTILSLCDLHAGRYIKTVRMQFHVQIHVNNLNQSVYTFIKLEF